MLIRYNQPQHNIILATDAYKTSHYIQYPSDLKLIQDYVAPRVQPEVELISLGSIALAKSLSGKVITLEKINEAEKIITGMGLPFNRNGWEYIIEEHGGNLPIKILALPEGSVFKGNQVQSIIENTDQKCAWLVGYLETLILRSFWYPTTVGSNSRKVKKMMLNYFPEINADALNFKLHDFGARGVSSSESASIGGAAHLVNFSGTDTIEAVKYIQDVYDTEEIFGFSIPASEHSTMTIRGRSGEFDQMKNMLQKFGKENTIFACVSDSFDYKKAVSEIWLGKLKETVIRSKATLVIRPDSGDIVENVIWTLKILWSAVGGTINKSGHKVIHPSFRIIQGDGIDLESLEKILIIMKENNFDLDNVAFGMGGGLLQQINRDTYKYAMKTCAAIFQGSNDYVEVYKDPITDPGKKSLRGNQKINFPELKLIFTNGLSFSSINFNDVREKALIF